jgi:co-chaperonin GroES (HSP10)
MTELNPETVRPLRDSVLLKRIPYKHPILVTVGIKLNKGEVIAIGPGRRVKRLVRYRRGEGKLTGDIYMPDGAERVGKDGKPLIRPMRVAIGDVVEFSPYKHQREFTFRGEHYVVLPEQSIYGRDPTRSQSEAALSQRSAGWETGRGGQKDTFLAR